MTVPQIIHYAYPSSEMGGKHGCYYVVNSHSGDTTKFDSEHVAIMTAAATGKAIANYGSPSRINSYRKFGVSHGLDGLPGDDR